MQESILNKTTRDFKNHIVPSFDGMSIREMKPDHCQTELNKWRDKLITYRRIKNHANRVFDYALRMDIIDSHPFDKGNLDLNWYTYFRILAYSGACKSETLALTWPDIDFDTSTSTKHSLGA